LKELKFHVREEAFTRIDESADGLIEAIGD
jgi:hypothetical protein